MHTHIPDPPVARVIPHTSLVFGQRREDDYYWLRERENPEVVAYLEAENAYTEAVLASTQPLQQRLYAEMLARIVETDRSAPAPYGPYWYDVRTEAGKQYKSYYRQDEAGNEELLLDENILADGQSYFRMAAFAISPDHSMLAYALDINGSERFDLFIKDIASGQHIDGPIPNVTEEIAWSADGRFVFYARPDAAWRTYQLWRHSLGKPESQDVLVYEEQDQSFWLHIHKTRSDAFLLLHLKSNTTSEYRMLAADQPEGDFSMLLPRRHGIECQVDHSGEWLYILTNEQARNFRILRVPVADPTSLPEELRAHHEDISIDTFELFAEHMAIYEREAGLQHICIHDLRTNTQRRIRFDEPAYALSTYGPFFNQDFNTPSLRFSYSSPITPPHIYDVDMRSGALVLRKSEDVPGYQATHYQLERQFASASDGTQVPLTIAYRKDTALDGTAPLFLYAYGSYGATVDPRFDLRWLPMLDRGFVCVIAHVRGGGEMGRSWYEDGKVLTKRNSFTDFIASAEYLIAQGYTNKESLVIKGRSAGGLLMGAVTTMRPELFKAVIAGVPFVDVVNTSLDPSIPLVVAEYEEWGDPRIPEQYEYLLSYSPYDQTHPAAYPHILATAGFFDPRVQYWEPAKWVAKLRTVNTSTHAILLKTEMVGGHSGPSGRYDYLKDVALEIAFAMHALGMQEE